MKALPLKTKIAALVGLWFTMLVSIIIVPILWVKFIMFIVALGVTLHIALIKTMSAEEKLRFEVNYQHYLENDYL